MVNFVFSGNSNVQFGFDARKQVGQEFKDRGVNKVLIVTDRGIVEHGLLEAIVRSLDAAGVRTALYQDVASNPTETDVANAASIGRMAKCGGVLAVGGGSSIDAAKGALVTMVAGGEIADYDGWDKVPVHLPPLIAIPTTAGTGSEVTPWAVITGVADHRKMVIGSPLISPTLALLDPEITYTLPASLTAYTGIDALTHAIEAFTSQLSNPISDALAIAAIEAIGRSLLKSVDEPGNATARAEMLVASTMAGIAFTSGDLGAVHSLSEALGGIYNIHHGLANAVVLAQVIEFNEPAAPHKFAQIGRALGRDDGNAVTAINELIQVLNIPTLSDLGIKKVDFLAIADLAEQNISTPNNPRTITRADFESILALAL